MFAHFRYFVNSKGNSSEAPYVSVISQGNVSVTFRNASIQSTVPCNGGSMCIRLLYTQARSLRYIKHFYYIPAGTVIYFCRVCDSDISIFRNQVCQCALSTIKPNSRDWLASMTNSMLDLKFLQVGASRNCREKKLNETIFRLQPLRISRSHCDAAAAAAVAAEVI